LERSECSGVKSFQPPRGLKRLHVFADNDSNYAGQAAAYDLAHRLRRHIPTVEVHIPPNPDTDWLDVLNGKDAYDKKHEAICPAI
jgi:putative DNA primase/helicase